MVKYTENGRQLIFWGDNHWSFAYIKELLANKELENTVLIQVGDFGIGFKHLEKSKSVLRKLNTLLIESNVTLYISRGNHDDPSYFVNNRIKMSNIIFLSDYTILQVNDHKILCIGGAVSIDQIHRSIGKTWWANEKVVYDEIVKSLRGITTVVTHTTICEAPPPLDMKVPILAHYSLMQPWLEYELRNERELLTRIYNELSENNTIERWYYGHFHKSFNETYKGTKFYGLAINELSNPI